MQIRELWSPEAAHCPPADKPFFEGWQFKLARADGRMLSIIPGISKDGEGNDCAFLQVFSPGYLAPTYIEMDIRHFHAASRPFEITLEDSRFTKKGVKLHAAGNGNRFDGLVRFKDMALLDKSIFSPSMMGPFAFITGLSCHHDVISLRHALEGEIVINGEAWDFNAGVGYIDKDWGLSFPNHLLWVQANQFEKDPQLSVAVCMARIHVGGISIPGVLCVVARNGRQYRYCTYNAAYVYKVDKKGENRIIIIIKKGGEMLKIDVMYQPINSLLPAPHMGCMRRKGVQEHCVEKLRVTLTRDGAPLVDDWSIGGGMQLAGDYQKLT